MDRFRILSDLHMDINEKYPFSVDDPSIFTVIAGDTSGMPYIVDASCDNPHIGISVESGLKVAEFFKGRKRASLSYDAANDRWMFGDRQYTKAESGINIGWNGPLDDRGERCHGDIPDGEKVKVRIKSPEDWIRKNVSRGVLVAGNHLVYNYDGLSLERLKSRLASRFPIDSDISFLDESTGTVSKEVDGIVFVGSTLYTDYELPLERRLPPRSDMTVREMNMLHAQPRMSGGGLNDFVYGLVEEGVEGSRHRTEGLFALSPRNYLNFFHRTMEAIERCVDANKDKDIVVVTHHCPSPRCISERYLHSNINASYVSDLEDFIIRHGNIRCWVCGHVHHRADFRVGNCLVVMNPLGYCKNGEFLGDVEWTPDTFVDTRTWTVERVPFKLDPWKRKYDDARRRAQELIMKYHVFF